MGVSSTRPWLELDGKALPKTAAHRCVNDRIREAWTRKSEQFNGPVEADETYMGGKRCNMSNAKRKGLSGRKTAVAGIKDRATNKVLAKVVESTDSEALQGFIAESVKHGATLYTDDASVYNGMVDFEHKSVKHSVTEYVRWMAHTNGIESFWSMLKRVHKDTFHKLSAKHLQRYVNELAWRHSIRDAHTIDQMESVVVGLVGQRLLFSNLVS